MMRVKDRLERDLAACPSMRLAVGFRWENELLSWILKISAEWFGSCAGGAVLLEICGKRSL